MRPQKNCDFGTIFLSNFPPFMTRNFYYHRATNIDTMRRLEFFASWVNEGVPILEKISSELNPPPGAWFWRFATVVGKINCIPTWSYIDNKAPKFQSLLLMVYIPPPPRCNFPVARLSRCWSLQSLGDSFCWMPFSYRAWKAQMQHPAALVKNSTQKIIQRKDS